jgi:hypothetical protein
MQADLSENSLYSPNKKIIYFDFHNFTENEFKLTYKETVKDEKVEFEGK